MDKPVAPLRNIRLWILAVAVLVAVAGYFLVERYQRQQEEYQTSLGIARVLSATFEKQNRLSVGEVSGTLDVTTVDPGMFRFLRSAQKAVLPYSVGYQVDLSQMSPRDYRWDKDSRTLRVEIPDVVPTRPNIDETARKTLATGGLFVTREAYDNLNRRAAVLATRSANAEARKPGNMAKARSNARDAVKAMLAAPLEVAGLGDVKVEVVFPFDGQKDGEQWDVSPSIEEVLARHQARQPV